MLSNNTEHLISKIPEKILEDILRPNKKGYMLKCCNLESLSAGGYIAHALSEILYAVGENGNQEVRYQRGKSITVTPKGLRALQNALK